MSTLPIANLLPPEVRDALIKASRTPGTDRDRKIAIEKATNFARRMKPALFKDENHEDQTFECPSFLSRSV